MTNYIEPEDFKAHAKIDDSLDDGTIDAAVTAASRAIDSHCGRVFTLASTATARIYYPCSRYRLDIDDLATTTSLVIKTGDGDGTFDTTWATSDYQLEPLNRTVDGIGGWPYTAVRAVGDNTFPLYTKRASVEVTGLWGWAAVPDEVEQACRVLAGWLWELRNARLGVAGFGEFGQIRVREHPVVSMLLKPFVKTPHGIG